MGEILVFVLRFFSWFCLLRFLFQLSGANIYNPFVSAFAKVTNPVLQPLRRFLPKHRLIDFSSGLVTLIANMLIVLLKTPIVMKIGAYHIPVIWGVVEALSATCWVYIIAIILSVLMSWIAPNVYSPATELARVLTEPILRPLRKFLPPMAGFDFSPMMATMGLFFVLFLLRQFSLMSAVNTLVIPNG